MKNITRVFAPILSILFCSCGQKQDESSESYLGMGYMMPETIGEPFQGMPWVTDLCIVDLDQDGLLDIVFSEARENAVNLLKQLPNGSFEESTLRGELAGPAHVEVVDFDGDEDRDILVSCMGIVTPNDQKIGSVVLLENDATGRFLPHTLIEGIDRVCYAGAADLDGDGDLDVSVGAFGYFVGRVCWLENRGDWDFAEHLLLSLPGTIHAPPNDFDGDGDIDIVALVSQDYEEVHLFENQGAGRFQSRILHGSTNTDYGSSGLTVSDLDLDGDLDFVYTNGDGFDYATPGSRPWHGAQWLENGGEGSYTYHRIGDMAGAYSPLVVDLDGDGDQDVVAVSGFNDWNEQTSISLAVFENDGKQNFVYQDLAYSPTHQIVVDAADLDGDGKVELVSGGFNFYPPTDRGGRVTLWRASSIDTDE